MMSFRRVASPGLPWAFVLALLVLGGLLTVAVVPGVFTVDEDNYLVNVLALRGGHLTLANTAGLPPSRELLFFDPGPWGRTVESTPVASNAPPLYAVLALPFSAMGWRGLVLLNTLAYLITISIVFAYTRRYAAEPRTPWIAAIAFGLGGFLLEYAQGVWPHALSVALCFGGVVAAGRSAERASAALPAFSGLLLAIAAGVRYQNAVVLVAALLAILIWAPRRWRSALAFSLAALIPLVTSAYINHVRFDSWNPISKGPGYLRLPVLQDSAASIWDPLVMFWALLVDFAARPPLVSPFIKWLEYDAASGAHVMLGEVPQKAVLQSAPWAVLGLIMLVLAWIPRSDMPEARRRQLKVLSLVAAALLATFAFAGVRRHDGLSFNQRYLIELIPLAAVGFAWALDGMALRTRVMVAGAVWGVLAAVIVLFALPAGTLKWMAMLKFPMLASAALAILWFAARRRGAARAPLGALAGLCLAWGGALHADDVRASRGIRAWNLEATNALRAVVPDHAALVTYWGGKDATGPLLFDRDVVVLDAHADEGQDAPMLIRELLARGRRVFVIQSGFPRQVLVRVFGEWAFEPVRQPGISLVELRGGRRGTASP